MNCGKGIRDACVDVEPEMLAGPVAWNALAEHQIVTQEKECQSPGASDAYVVKTSDPLSHGRAYLVCSELVQSVYATNRRRSCTPSM